MNKEQIQECFQRFIEQNEEEKSLGINLHRIQCGILGTLGYKILKVSYNLKSFFFFVEWKIERYPRFSQ
jgi:hypothetical protein